MNSALPSHRTVLAPSPVFLNLPLRQPVDHALGWESPGNGQLLGIVLIMDPSSESAVEDAEATPRAPADWARGFTPGRLALLTVLLLFAQYPEVMLGTHSFFDRDFGLFTCPVA